MAQFVIGSDLVDDSVRKEKERKEQENQEKARRHYKKDSRCSLQSPLTFFNMLPRYLEDLYTLTYQEDSLDRDEEEDPEVPAWGARYVCSDKTCVGKIKGKIFGRTPLRSPQPLASLQVGRQAPRHGLVRYIPNDGTIISQPRLAQPVQSCKAALEDFFKL